MKNKKVVWIIVTITAFCIIGCSSVKPVTYNFSENKETNGTASLYIFNVHHNTESGLISNASYAGTYRIVDFEGIELPESVEGTRWDPLIVPAGRELNIRVSFDFYDKYNNLQKRRGIFKCPPLESGKKYKLWFEPSQHEWGLNDAGHLGAGRLILTDAKVKKLKYVFHVNGSPTYKQIYVQEIPPLAL